MTIEEVSPELIPQAESLLWFLEANPSELPKVLEHFDIEIARSLCKSRMIWFQGHDLTFYITHAGIGYLRSLGRGRKKLSNLSWKHNPHEMTADRAIELFAEGPKALEGEGVSIVPRSPKPRYKQISTFIVKKSKHLPKKK
jgi:hypothetical protein